MAGLFALGLILIAVADDRATAADAIEIGGGRVVLGQLVEPIPRGKVALVVRRRWAEENLPDLSRRWLAAERPGRERALRQRRDRLIAWRRERKDGPDGPDRLAAWLDAEIARLAAPGADEPPLMVVTLAKTEVRSIAKRPPEVARLLRRAWAAGLESPESLAVADLTAALEARGVPTGDVDEAPIDRLLPIPAEDDARWHARRAATEIREEPALRWVRYGDLVYPEGEPGAAPDQAAMAGAALGALRGLLDDGAAPDPLAAKFDEAAARGRIGLLVTSLTIGESLDRVTVEAVLYVRRKGSRWTPAGRWPVVLMVDRVGEGGAGRVAADPQVGAAFAAVEALGLGAVDESMKRRAVRVGAAVQQAIGEARGAVDRDLAGAALIDGR